jgi:Fe-coproporphyrin III synthase
VLDHSGLQMDLVQQNRLLNTEEVRSGETRLRSAPLQVNVELTGICNVNPPCVFCSGKNFGHSYGPLDVSYLESYSSLLERCEHVNEDSFGEPLGHPALVELARRFTTNGQVFSFVTNGLLLTKDRADQLAALGPKLGVHVSLNASTEGTFYKLTGKRFSRVVENVRYYVQSYKQHNLGATPDLILTFIVMKINRAEVADFLRLTSALGAPRALLAPLHDRPSQPIGHFGYDFVYEDEMLPYGELVRVGREATRLARELGIECLLQWDAARDSAIRGFSEPGVGMPCLVPWRFLFIQEHAKKVFACPYHRLPHGDLEGATLEEIWNGDTAQQMRRSLARGEIPGYCLDCSAACPLVLAAHERPLGDVEPTITMGENDVGHLTAGWYPLERVPEAIRWTSKAAGFLIRVDGGDLLQIEAISWRRGPAAESVCGRVELAERSLGPFRLMNDGWNLLSFRVPPGREGRVAEGRILTDDTWVPARAGVGGDTRQLGIAVRRISLAREGPIGRLFSRSRRAALVASLRRARTRWGALWR